MEPLFNEPLFNDTLQMWFEIYPGGTRATEILYVWNELLGITNNNFLVKYIETRPEVTKPRYNKYIFPAPLPLAISRFYCTKKNVKADRIMLPRRQKKL